MISLEQERRELCEIYYKFEEYPTPDVVGISDYAGVRLAVAAEVRSCLEHLRSKAIGTKSMDTALRRSKLAYHRYCAICCGSEGFENKGLVELVALLISEITTIEASMLHELRIKNPKIEDVQIGKSINSKKEMMHFIGETAEKYFISRCKNAKWAGQNADLSIVTAFIDESCRNNPWRVYDGSLPAKQTSISYIICQGWIDNECRISERNIIEMNACLARWSDDPTSAAVEAVNVVLESLLIKYKFSDNVVIYTDNNGAVCNWRKNDVSKGLESMFKSVTVSYIPRVMNRKADQIGRERIFADISKDTMRKVETAMHGVNLEDDTLDLVESFFPEPDKDLPKLVSDLENLSTAVGYLSPAGDRDYGAKGSGSRIRSLLSSIRQGILAGAVS